MAGFLTQAFQKTCFVVRQSALTKHLVLPPEMNFRVVPGKVELVDFAKLGFGRATRVGLVLADHDFIPTINLLREGIGNALGEVNPDALSAVEKITS